MAKIAGANQEKNVKIGHEVCSRCGQPLIEMLWSKSDGIYILTCDNAGCACYRNPVKTIVKEA